MHVVLCQIDMALIRTITFTECILLFVLNVTWRDRYLKKDEKHNSRNSLIIITRVRVLAEL